MRDETISKQVWNRFVQEGVMESTRINSRITESWYLCRQNNVNPYSGVGREILSADSLRLLKEKNKPLLDLTAPCLEKVMPFVRETGMIALVIDPQGYVLSRAGSLPVLEEASRINFVEGVRWTETDVGTNAIGTALRSGEPIMVVGMEHYSLASHKWGCSAAPIRDDTGKLVGILDISSPVERHHAQILGLVASMAYGVEREWDRRRRQDEVELLQLSLEMLENEPFAAVCNIRNQVVAVSKTLRQSFLNWYDLTWEEWKECGYQEFSRTPLYSRKHGGVIGSFVILRKMERKSRHAMTAFDCSLPAFQFPGVVGSSKRFRQLVVELARIARSDSNVCIEGESGTGKELIARSIHANSLRKNGPFVALNCGAVPRDLIESELFGYAEGAFTGARRGGYKGKLEQANGGTLFLDEIGEISPAMQIALLRVLQEKKVTPIGGSKEISLDIRVIAATHRDLRQLVREGAFRQDLFYRLYVLPVSVPPLRARKEDIPALIRYYCQKNKWQTELPSPVVQQLLDYDWPGNIRELFNVLERLSLVSPEEMEWRVKEMLLGEYEYGLGHRPSFSPPVNEDLLAGSRFPAGLTFRDQLERQSIVQALMKAGGSASRAARLLGMPRSTFYRKLRKYQL